MSPDQLTDDKKDKRLLVLLALGTLVILLHCSIPAQSGKGPDPQWRWLELNSAPPSVVRMTQTDSTVESLSLEPAAEQVVHSGSLIPEHGAIRITFSGGDYTSSPHISPRLAFFLGMPLPINRANELELTMLPGIGPVLAANIISYRAHYGPITNRRILQSVQGIGERLSARLIPLITFE